MTASMAAVAIVASAAMVALAMAWADPAGDWLAGMREMVEERREWK